MIFPINMVRAKTAGDESKKQITPWAVSEACAAAGLPAPHGGNLLELLEILHLFGVRHIMNGHPLEIQAIRRAGLDKIKAKKAAGA